MSKLKKHIDKIFSSGIVNNDSEQYIHIRSDGRSPRPNEFKILNDDLYVSKSTSNGVTWIKYEDI